MAPRKGIDWDKVEDLGKVPDTVIARRLGCHHTCVFEARRKRGLPRYSRWDTVTDLGIMADSDLARYLGINRSAVGTARKARGIPSPSRQEITCIICGISCISCSLKQCTCGDKSCSNKLTSARKFFNLKQNDDLDPTLVQAYQKLVEAGHHLGLFNLAGINWDDIPLGILSDREIARRTGRNVNSIAKARAARHIPTKFPKNIDWSSYTDLGQIPDKVLAQKYNCDPSSIQHARKRLGIPACPRGYIEWDTVTDLGKVPDAVIAKRYNCTPSAVQYARKGRGIPACPVVRRPLKKIDWDSVKDLGLESDFKIAQRLGCSAARVHQKRNQLGIIPSSQRYAKGENSSLGNEPRGDVVLCQKP